MRARRLDRNEGGAERPRSGGRGPCALYISPLPVHYSIFEIFLARLTPPKLTSAILRRLLIYGTSDVPNFSDWFIFCYTVLIKSLSYPLEAMAHQFRECNNPEDAHDWKE